MKKTTKNTKSGTQSKTWTPAKKAGRPSASQAQGSVKDRVLRVILRGRGESLGEACKSAGLTPTTYYYYVKTASFGNPKRGRAPKFSLSAQDVRKFNVILKKHTRIESELKKLENRISTN